MFDKLTNIKSVLDNSGTLTKADKDFIKASYLEVIGKEFNGKTKCRNCWKDALIEMIVKLSPNKIRMYCGCVEIYNGVQYTHRNITDAIARKIMEENPNSKTSFYGTL